jgi:hypothetical protein
MRFSPLGIKLLPRRVERRIIMDLIIPIMIVLGLVIIVIMMIVCSGEPHEKHDTNAHALKLAYMMRVTWLRSSMMWMYVDYELTAVSFVSSMIVVYIMSNTMSIESYRTHIIIYSIISAVTTLINYSITPKRQAVSYRKAYMRISEAINRYNQIRENDQKAEDVYKAIKEGESYIHTSLE